MPLPENFVDAVYIDPGLDRYRGNPLIEALPPIMDLQALKVKLTGKLQVRASRAAGGRLRRSALGWL